MGGETVMPSVDEVLEEEEEAEAVLPEEKKKTETAPEAGSEKEKSPPAQGLPPADGMSWDFGVVTEGMVLEHEFFFENGSEREVRITGINTSCGCTASRAEKESLLPGERTPITVMLNTKGYRGSIKQSVFVHTDDPARPVLRYIIRAQILSPGEEVE